MNKQQLKSAIALSEELIDWAEMQGVEIVNFKFEVEHVTMEFEGEYDYEALLASLKAAEFNVTAYEFNYKDGYIVVAE